MKKTYMLLLLVIATSQVNAEGLDTKKIYFGGGLGFNDANFGDVAIGFQLFAGLLLPVKIDKTSLSVEVGYMDSGSFDRNAPFGTISAKANGLWGTAVASVPLQDDLSLIGRLGLDIGDDDGIMIGAGLGLKTGEKMEIRFEYIIRDNISSLQANLLIKQ